MWSACTVFALVVLLLLVLVWYTSSNQRFPGASPWLLSLPKVEKVERFDTGYNHDLGAMEDYYGTDVPVNPSLAARSAVRAKYTWAEADPLGLNVYDRYYEQDLQTRQEVSSALDPFLQDRLFMSEGNVQQPPSDPAASVDTAFALYNAPYALYQLPDVAGMYSPQPSTTVNGQVITLSQKSY